MRLFYLSSSLQSFFSLMGIKKLWTFWVTVIFNIVNVCSRKNRINLFSIVKYRLFLVLFSLFVFSSSWGQALSQYSFSASAGTYTSIVAGGGTNTATLSNGNTDDGFYNNLAIGFSFNYCGINYTSFSASTNGWLTFGQSISDAAFCK